MLRRGELCLTQAAKDQNMRMVAINKLLRGLVWPRRRINVQRDQSIRLDDFVDQPGPLGNLVPNDGHVYGTIPDSQCVIELRFER